MAQDFDIAIVGGGMVGGSLACALGGTRWRVVQIEAQPPRSAAPAWDERHFALARRSVLALEEWGVWEHARDRAHAIAHVHVSSRGDFGAVRIAAVDYGLPALGHTVPARVVGEALEQRTAALTNLQRISPARVLGVAADENGVSITCEAAGARRTLRARLLVAADGSDSFVRGASGIEADTRDYGQTAIATTVASERAHEGRAYERFGDGGALALLPLADERCGLVWTLPVEEAGRVLALDDDAFLALARERFGPRLGALRRVGRRQPWPLRLVQARALHAPRTVLVGNAAQTIHPIGAQGFNLGLRDVLSLCDALASCASGDPGAPAVLESHASERAADRARTIAWSEDLVRWFSRPGALARVARGAALAALERMPALKRDLAFAMMGYRSEARAGTPGAPA